MALAFLACSLLQNLSSAWLFMTAHCWASLCPCPTYLPPMFFPHFTEPPLWLPVLPCHLPSALLSHSLSLSPLLSTYSTTPVHCMAAKARSSENLHCPTSRLEPRIFWWLQMWLVVVLISKMYLWLSTMIWPKILKVSACLQR